MILCSREMAIVMMRPMMKSATGMEEIVAAQMRQWTTALNVFVLITRKNDQNRLKMRPCL